MSFLSICARGAPAVVLGSLLALTGPASTAAQPLPPTTAPRVVVRDSAGTRIPYASVQAGGSTARTASDSGIATLRVPRADSLKLLARRIGFEPFEGWTRPDSAGDYHVRLRPLPQNLARVSIYSRDTPLSRTGFYDRLDRVERGAYSARMLTPEMIELRNPSHASVLFEGEAIVRVRPMSGKPVLAGRGGTCPMGVVVDGQRMANTVEEISTREGEDEVQEIMRRERVGRGEAERRFLWRRESIDDLVNSLSVVAVEIYASMAAVPAELQRVAPSYACGLVVVWTGRR